MAKIVKQIKIQKQGAVSMTIPMIMVHSLGIKVKDYLIVSLDEENKSMIIVQDKGQKISPEQHRIKVQRQGALNMTVPMSIVRALDIRIGEFVDVAFDPIEETMTVTKSLAKV